MNEYVTDTIDEVEILRVDPESERQQLERLEAFKEDRDQDAVEARLEELRARLRAAARTCSCRCAPRSRSGPASARSAASCATSSASTPKRDAA